MNAKAILKSMVAAAMAAMAAVACSPEEFDGPDPTKIPVTADYEQYVQITVDQETNTVNFNFTGTGAVPVWIIDGQYSTTMSFSKVYQNAGEYSVQIKFANANGQSDGTLTRTFTVENTLVNFDRYYTLLSGRQWRIASGEAAHLGCGEPGTDGTGWYSAQANEKADFGIYDDYITFTAEGEYTYNPGADGLTYINTGCTIFAEYNTTGADFDAPTMEQTATYEIVAENDNIYLVLPANTLFPYICNDAQYANPRFQIAEISSSRLVLINDNGEIAWHFILTSTAATDEPDTPAGLDPDSDNNLLKGHAYEMSYYYAPGWSQIADPVLTQNGNDYTFALPQSTSDTWQAQIVYNTTLGTNSATQYDFGCKLMSTTDHGNVTVKLVQKTDDGNFYFEEKISLKAYEEYIFTKGAMDGLDIDELKIVFDFGGNTTDTEVTISDIVLQVSTGEIPGGTDEPAVDNTVYTYDAETNLWKVNVDDTDNYTTFFFYAPGWTEIPGGPGFSGAGGVYNVALASATTDQWQAQVHLISTIPGEAETAYDFSCTIESDKDLPKATVKVTDTKSDDNFLFTETPAIPAYEEYVVKVPNVKLPIGAADALKLVLDFGGNAENTNVTIKNIILQKHVE